MPPKPKFSREEVVRAAFAIARRKGANRVTARDIAAELHVSTRPVFTYFDSMEQVNAEVLRSAEALFETYIADGLSKPIPFLGVGMQYIRFAQEEPMLFRALFLESGNAMATLQHTQELVCPSLTVIYHLDEATARRYYRDMWLVVYGLCTLLVSGGGSLSETETERILSKSSLSTLKAYKEIPGFPEGSYDRDEAFRELILK